MTGTGEEVVADAMRPAHAALCDDLKRLPEVQQADAMNPSTSRGDQWTTEVVQVPGHGIATADILDTISEHGMGVKPPVLSRGDPPRIVLRVRKDGSRAILEGDH